MDGVDWFDLTQGGGEVAGCYERGSEHSDSIKFGELLNYRRY